MLMADYLSRVALGNEENRCLTGAVTSTPPLVATFWEVNKLKEAQQEDEGLRAATEAMVERKGEATLRGELSPFQTRLRVSDGGVLCYVVGGGRRSKESPFGSKETWVPVIPAPLRAHALQLVHDAPLSGHMGERRTWERARDSFWWPEMKKDVAAHISKCEACQRNRTTKLPGKAPL